MFHVARAGRSCDVGVGRVCGLEGTGEELCGDEGEVVVYWEGLGCGVKIVDGSHLNTTGGNSEGVVLDDLELGDVRGRGVGIPDWSGVEEEGSNYGLVSDGYGFGLMAPSGGGKAFENVQSGGSACNYVGDVITEGEMGV